MLRKLAYLLTGCLVVLALHFVSGSVGAQSPARGTHGPRYTSDGRMEPPTDYPGASQTLFVETELGDQLIV